MLPMNMSVIIGFVLISLLGGIWLIKANHGVRREQLATFFRYIRYPLISFLVLSAANVGLEIMQNQGWSTDIRVPFINDVVEFLLIVIFYWLVIQINKYILHQLQLNAIENKNVLGKYIYPLLYNGLRVVFLLLFVNLAFYYFSLPEEYLTVLSKAVSIVLIVTVAWLILQIMNTVERVVVERYMMTNEDKIYSQKVLTQLRLIKRITFSIIIILTVIGILMTFDKVRQIGATLLASAGLLAAIVSFAAQKSLVNLFSGLQILFSQPIRIDDAVSVENEFGTVEDINLTYVVIKLWDLRRLILPISYFIDKPFQNWSREAGYLFGTVFIYLDFGIPIDEVRAKFHEILSQSQLWDKKVGVLQVSDMKQDAIELRLLVSAQDAGKLWDLRCEVREKIIRYIQEYQTTHLPRYRITNV